MAELQSIDGLVYGPDRLLGGDNIVVYCGPPKMSDLVGTDALSDPGESEASDTPRLVGVIQQLSIQSGRPQRQINEIGSNAKYLVSSRGQKQMTISRIVTTHGNALYSLYRYHIETSQSTPPPGPTGKIWLTLSHPIFRKPIGLLFITGYYNDANTWVTMGGKYHENVVISSIGAQITEGDVGIADNISLTWSNTCNWR